MKRIALVIILASSFAAAQVPLAPDIFSFTWTRQGTTALADTNTWLSGVTYLLTNCIAMNGSNTQDLTNCGIVIRVGDTTTNLSFNGTIQNASNGTFSCYFTIPTSPSAVYGPVVTINGISQPPPARTTGVQLTLTNGTVTVTDREIKQLRYVNPLM